LSSDLIKIVLEVEYEGANYCGFQFQENVKTVQDEIEKALFKLTGEKLRVISASRTDTGVHARGQVISYWTAKRLARERILNGLNYHLPQDIAVKAVYKVNSRFNVQRDAVSREYSYLIWNSSTRSPLQRAYTHQVRSALDIEAMNRACELLLGEHDLSSFITDFSQSIIKSTVKTVFSTRVEKEGDMVKFHIAANAFLPHQVRNTVGLLIRVGQRKITVKKFKNIMEAKQPGLAGPTVPAQGLYLMRVNYPRPLGEYHDENL
jgi:tRNA pseudouridine38-40 synthase